MGNLAEFALGLATDPLGRGIGSYQFRILLLQFLQPAHEPVVLRIRHTGRIENVVLIVPRLQLRAQGLDFQLNISGWHGKRLG